MKDPLPLAKPPEGVISGSSVPRENEKMNREEREAVDRMVAIMKTRESYSHKSDSKLREMAKERLL